MTKRLEQLLPLADNTNGTTHIALVVSYNKGGMNYATYKTEPRGIYVSATPIKIEEHNGIVIRCYTAFSGIAYFLEDAKRLNQKRVQAVFDMTLAEFNGKTGNGYKIVQAVLNEHNLKLAELAAA